MRRIIVSLALVLALVLSLGATACGGDAAGPEAGADATDQDAASGDVAVAGFEAMSTDGAHESAALDAVAGIVEEQKQAGTWTGIDWEAVEKVDPVFVAYLVRVDYAGQVGLFEVRADGIAHNIYGYQRAFDSGSIIWTSSDLSQGAVAEPASAGESAAVASVDAAMRDAFPDEPFQVRIQGYRFVHLVDGASAFTVEVAPDSSMISAGM